MINENNTKYQYIRFNDGKEIFAMVSEVDNKLMLHLPMSIHTKSNLQGNGVVMHLGPMIPFTLDNTIEIDTKDITTRTSITDQYISFYDQACTTWLDMRDNNKIEIKTQDEVNRDQKESLKELIEKRLARDFESVFDDLDPWDDEELELPREDDIIH
tara:strand:- start:479 stop:949 length:471 start_codon:yes stop_codon:yes gene_type:complete